MKQDYYDGMIQERGAAAAAPLLADECRKGEVESEILRRALRDIVVRCSEGDKHTDWLPIIQRIAEDALSGAAGEAHRRTANAHALAEERSDDSQQRVVGGKVDR